MLPFAKLSVYDSIESQEHEGSPEGLPERRKPKHGHYQHSGGNWNISGERTGRRSCYGQRLKSTEYGMHGSWPVQRDDEYFEKK